MNQKRGTHSEIENDVVIENLRKEFDRIVGEPGFAAVKTFKFDYSDYQIRKFK